MQYSLNVQQAILGPRWKGELTCGLFDLSTFMFSTYRRMGALVAGFLQFHDFGRMV